ncbi:universal stress protein [Mucilaginibacter terrenus]|uniref:Universal stress protein n=1 Tax=Mucilaginibacter terrenus TaxID=2482727 RepID=A0A3E2NP55_9SPHI|nr:universal stress protein [Mucilaginibacter terrenus]RFZ82670.1 universal stress protein [Mucilaginibacter terrenus]
MEKIMVTTDMSVNSKSALRFAVQQAVARTAELEICYVYHLIKPFNWSPLAFEIYTTDYKRTMRKELSAFVRGILRQVGNPSLDYQLALIDDSDVTEGIIRHAVKERCSFICIATRGAGPIKKLFGTHTSNLIGRSPVPVLTIPSHYRLKPLQTLLYASDLTDYKRELKQVISFAQPVNANIQLLYLKESYETDPTPELVSATLSKQINYNVEVIVSDRKIVHTLLDDIGKMLHKINPDLLVLVTHQERSLTEKLLYPSNAKNYSFKGKLPLLTLPKLPE